MAEPGAAATPPRRSRLAIAAALAALIVLGGAGAYAITRDPGADEDPTGATITPEAKTATAPAPGDNADSIPRTTAAPPSRTSEPSDAAQNALDAYVRAYEQEDVAELGKLFTATLTRFSTGEPPENRAQALDTYGRQFEGIDDPRYRLSRIRISDSGAPTTASADYAISGSNRGTVAGQITFTFAQVDGQLLIDRISVVPE